MILPPPASDGHLTRPCQLRTSYSLSEIPSDPAHRAGNPSELESGPSHISRQRSAVSRHSILLDLLVMSFRLCPTPSDPPTLHMSQPQPRRQILFVASAYDIQFPIEVCLSTDQVT